MRFTSEMRFLDTNVLLYSVSQSPDEQAKARVALHLLKQQDLGPSIQVFQEFYAQATRARHPLTHQQAERLSA